jgi:hypothetical protein
MEDGEMPPVPPLAELLAAIAELDLVQAASGKVEAVQVGLEY